jgi:ribonuclease BN (tRNA processing enzyme)
MKRVIVAITMLLVSLHAEMTLQVLGSGGPELTDNRASSAYLIWIDHKAKILIDFGGGASFRYEESGAKIEDLDVILLTHLHVDHTSDLPALLKASFFTSSRGDLHLFGPDKNDIMPATTTFIDRLFKNKRGAWQYLGDNLDGSAPLQLKAHTIQKTLKPTIIYKQGDLVIKAISVHHGPIPALAYRIEKGGKSITFSGDMNGEFHTLEKLAYKTDILVAHNAVPTDTEGAAANLHMTPATIGEIAQKAEVKSLVLSHRMTRTLGKEKETQCAIRANYEEEISYADDGDKYPVE